VSLDFYCGGCGKFKPIAQRVQRPPARPVCTSCMVKIVKNASISDEKHNKRRARSLAKSARQDYDSLLPGDHKDHRKEKL